MYLPFLHPTTGHPDPAISMPEPESGLSAPPAVIIHEEESLSMEGGEFFDDGLRMEDLAYLRTEEIVAAGTPGHLLL